MKAEVIDRLKAQLLVSGIQQQNQALFQVINLLIDAARSTAQDVQGSSGSGGGGGGGGTSTESFLTTGLEQGTLTNSRQIRAGSGITFMDNGVGLLIGAAPIPMGCDCEELEAYIPLPGPQGPVGATGSSSTFLGIPLPTEPDDDIPDIIPPLGIIGSMLSPNWVNIPYDSANFTGNGTIVWTVDAGDQTDFSYKIIDGNTVILNIRIETTDLSGAGNILRIALPAAITPKKGIAGPALIIDAGTVNPGGFFSMAAGTAAVTFVRNDFGNFTVTAADNTGVFVVISYEI